MRGPNGEFRRGGGNDLEEFGYEAGNVVDKSRAGGRVGPESRPPLVRTAPEAVECDPSAALV